MSAGGCLGSRRSDRAGVIRPEIIIAKPAGAAQTGVAAAPQREGIRIGDPESKVVEAYGAEATKFQETIRRYSSPTATTCESGEKNGDRADSLRRELMFLDVRVIKIQPGPFRTGMVAGIERSFARAAEASTYFNDMLKRLGRVTLKEQAKAHDPALLAEVVHTALTTPHPRIAYSVKPDLQRTALNWLPACVADPLLKLELRVLS